MTIADDPTVPSASHLKPHPFALQDSLADVYPAHTRVVHAASGTACTQAYAVSQQGARKLLWQFGLQTLTTGWDLMLRDWCDGFYPPSEGAREEYAAVGEDAGEKKGTEGQGRSMGGAGRKAGIHGQGNSRELEEDEADSKRGSKGGSDENERRGLGFSTGGSASSSSSGGTKRAVKRREHPLCVTVQPPLFSHHYGRGAASDITAPGGGFVNREKEMTPYVRQSVRLNMERLVRGLSPRDQWGEEESEK